PPPPPPLPPAPRPPPPPGPGPGARRLSGPHAPPPSPASARPLESRLSRLPVPFEERRKGRLGRLRKSLERERLGKPAKPRLAGRPREARAQPRDHFLGCSRSRDERRHRGQGRGGEHADARREVRRVPGDQEMPVGIEGADVDAPCAH